ncbi:MAG TPA: HD domain-containing protein [Candidatus Dormibacteraeota bacterium]
MASVHPAPRPASLEDILDGLAAIARANGIEAYLVGGFVRDRLLGLDAKDLDVLIVGGGPDGQSLLLSALSARFGWSRPQLFERFGTGQVRGDGWVVEAVLARGESYDPSSRRPSVRPGTLDEDLWRRDFTVNTLAQTLEGAVIDRTGRGLDDLAAGVLRTPLDPLTTFAEDPLRIYRAARFTAQLGFTLAPGMLEAMREGASRTAILSIERVRGELQRLLVGAHPHAGLSVLDGAGLLERILPEIVAMHGVEQSGYHCYDVYEHTLRAVEAAPPDLVTRLAALLHDVGKPPCHALDERGRHTFHDHPVVGAAMAETILERLRFSNDETRDVATLVRLHLRPISYDPGATGDAAVRRLIRAAGPLRGRLIDLARADTAASSYPTMAELDELQARMERLDSDGAVSALRSPLDGDELQRRAGRGPGRWIREAQQLLIDAVLDARLDATDPEAAWRLLEAERPDLTRPA